MELIFWVHELSAESESYPKNMAPCSDPGAAGAALLRGCQILALVLTTPPPPAAQKKTAKKTGMALVPMYTVSSRAETTSCLVFLRLFKGIRICHPWGKIRSAPFLS